MTVALWRVASDTPDWLADDLSGAGAATNGARWNRPGERVAYASTSVALAAWETRAQVGRGIALPWNRYLVRIDVPDAVWAARSLLPRPSPVGWDAIPEGAVSRGIGSVWMRAAQTALLAVPSAIVAEEDNVLINPAHADSRQIVAARLRRFLYDPRV